MKPTTTRMQVTSATASATPAGIPTRPNSSTSLSKSSSELRSAIHFAQHDVDRADDGDCIREHGAGQHGLQHRQVAERRTAHAAAVRHLAAVADQVVAELATRVLDTMVTFARLALEREQLDGLR